MRLFYDNWILLDANSSVATDELVKPASALAEFKAMNVKVELDIEQLGCVALW
jgi:hypothetical protein